MHYISRLIRSCDLSIYSFKKWQRLTRTFDKKIEMQTTMKKTWEGGREERRRQRNRGETMMGAKKKSGIEYKRRVNSMSKRGKTERIVYPPQLMFKQSRLLFE